MALSILYFLQCMHTTFELLSMKSLMKLLQNDIDYYKVQAHLENIMIPPSMELG